MAEKISFSHSPEYLSILNPLTMHSSSCLTMISAHPDECSGIHHPGKQNDCKSTDFPKPKRTTRCPSRTVADATQHHRYGQFFPRHKCDDNTGIWVTDRQTAEEDTERQFIRNGIKNLAKLRNLIELPEY